MDFLTLGLITAVTALILQWIWKFFTDGFDLFESQGIPYLKPVPFFGSMLPVYFRKASIAEFIQDTCEKFPTAKIIGIFDRNVPVYMVKDPELLKQICVKDFEYFIDRRKVGDGHSDPLLGNNLANMEGQKWKDMRSTLSPVFTGSKMRQMFGLMPEIGRNMVEYFKHCKSSDRCVEMKDVFGRFAIDGIATTNFGVTVDSFKEKMNKFCTKVQELMDRRSVWFHVRIMFIFSFPSLARTFKLRLIPEERTRFFEDLVRDTQKSREMEGVSRPDLIGLLAQIKKGQLQMEKSESDDIGFATVQEADLGKVTKRVWTEMELIAQAFIFFFAGFETVSTLAAFLSYELMLQPAIQHKLIEEVDAVTDELQGDSLTYETLQKMKYMDMVVSEGLRYWPPADRTERLCVKDYRMKNEKGDEIIIKKGSLIMIPIVGLHYAAEHFETPKNFDPERFSDANKRKINSGAFLPFGIGPRNCVGSRYALMAVKAVFYYLLKDFTFEKTEKTEIPLRMAKGLGKVTENGIWLKLEPRNK